MLLLLLLLLMDKLQELLHETQPLFLHLLFQSSHAFMYGTPFSSSSSIVPKSGLT